MIPLKDDRIRNSFPVFTLLLIAVNTLVFLYEASLGPRAQQVLVFQYGMVPTHMEAALTHSTVPIYLAIEPIFTSMFLHGGWLHLIGNMWFLWVFGITVEDRMGHAWYLIFYLLCGLAAGVTHTVVNWNSHLPAIGASGAIAGVMGAYLVLFPRAKILTLVPLLFFFFFWRLPAIVMIGFWFAIQFFNGVASLGVRDAGDVAWWAHVGGFALGAVIALGMRVEEPTYA